MNSGHDDRSKLFGIDEAFIMGLHHDRLDPAEETAVIGGGCVWCLEPVLKALNGVSSVVSG